MTYLGVCDKFLRDSGCRIPAENATFFDSWQLWK